MNTLSANKILKYLLITLQFISNRLKDVSPFKFVLLVTVMNIVIYNGPVLTYALDNLSTWSLSNLQTFVLLNVVIFLITSLSLFILLIINRNLAKIICAIAFCINASALYFIVQFQVKLDRDMMGNIFNTSFDEAGEFLSISYLLHLVMFAVIPSVIILKTNIQPISRIRLAIQAIATFLICAIFIYISSSAWLWIDKHAKSLGSMILPWSYIINTARYKAHSQKHLEEQTLLPSLEHMHNEKTIVVLVIGETARSSNFSLYGYNKNTNPLLEKQDIASIKDAQSCTTYTTGSLKCILSHTKSDSAFSENFEPLPSYLNRHDVDVIWRTNNWGEPHIQTTEYLEASDLKKVCTGKTCTHDEVILHGLHQRILDSKKNKIFVVLHQKGSHGPAYNTRYPNKFEHFTPVCESVELSKCSTEELFNAYDNTIVYTDHFLNRVITGLQNLKGIPSTMMYVSDHGESLGEFGLYLHGTPFSLAPDVQKDIPFIVWMSESFKTKHNVSANELEKTLEPGQHNIFHSTLGAFGITSPVYEQAFDIFQTQK